MPMLLGQVIDALAAEGFPANPDSVHYALSRRKVPKPPQDAAHRFLFGREHLDALRRYFRAKQLRKSRRQDQPEPARA